MAKILIWPDIYREAGHWLPCVTLAKTLIDAGHTVRFMGIEDCRAIVAPYGATFDAIFPSIYPPGHSFENRLEPLNQRWKPHHLLPITRGELDAQFSGSNKPDLLIGGYFTGLETLLLHRKYGVKFALITTYLRHPDDDPAIFAKRKLLNMPEAVAQLMMDSVVPPEARGISIEDFVVPLQNAKEMIPCPRQLDYTDPDWVHRAQVTYVEPMIVRQHLAGGTIQIPADEAVTVPQGKRVIYATSGSMVQDYEPRARLFFKALIAMMQAQGMSDYLLVIAAGAKLATQLRKEYSGANGLPTNVLLRDWISQLDILGVADAAFIHGGLATVKESIWEQVPIIIVPHGKDQMDNARRIQRTGVGVVAEILDLDPQDLRTLLTKATSSTWIRQNLIKLQAVLATEENKPAAQKLSVGIINGVLSA
jgi:UDP:flavonoid glycosyltransferase YjiC (YdhE family)